MGNESIRYLIVPGWQGSSDDHWQTHWQNSLPNSTRVEQDDWLTPRREDWIAALAEAIAADSTPVILIAHSLGCITVAHWAERAPSSLLNQVRGALLDAGLQAIQKGEPLFPALVTGFDVDMPGSADDPDLGTPLAGELHGPGRADCRIVIGADNLAWKRQRLVWNRCKVT